MRLSIGFRIVRQDPGHTEFDLFVGSDPTGELDWLDITRARAGTGTVLQTAEFNALVARLARAEHTHVDVYRGPHEDPHPCKRLTGGDDR